MKAKKKVTVMLVALAASAFSFSAFAADDITVDYGQERTLESGDYGAIVVNGTLNVAEDAVVSCTSLKIGVKSDTNGADNQAVYTQGAGAKVVVSGKNAGDISFGVGARAKVSLDEGATLSAAGHAYVGNGNEAGATVQVEIILENASFDSNGMSVIATSSSSSNADLVTVRLKGAQARFEPRHVNNADENVAMRFLFEGGVLVGDKTYGSGSSAGKNGLLRVGTGTAKNTVTRLESVNGCPIRVCCGGQKCQSAVFQPKGSGGLCTFETLGSGAFVLEGPANIPLIYNVAQCADLVNFNHTGGFRISSGTTFVLDAGGVTTFGKMTSGSRISIPVGGVLDLNGCDLAVGSIDSAGTIVDRTGGTPTITLGGDGADSEFSVPPAAGIKLSKVGAGRLILPEGSLNEVSVSAGSVDFCNRSAVGFPYWRFWVTEPPKGTSVRFTEFAASNGTQDVRADMTAVSYSKVGGYWYESPSNLFDGDLTGTYWHEHAFASYQTGDISNRVFFVMHFGGAPQVEFEQFETPDFRTGVTFEPYAGTAPVPAVNGKIDRYAFFTMPDNKTKHVSPETFRLQGSLTGNDWRDVDVVEGYADVSSQSSVWTKLFSPSSYGKSSVSVGTLEIADNTEWTIDLSQTDLTVGTLKAGRNVVVRLRNYGKKSGVKTLPAVFTACDHPENIASWKLFYDDEADAAHTLSYENGMIRVNGPGLVILLK